MDRDTKTGEMGRVCAQVKQREIERRKGERGAEWRKTKRRGGDEKRRDFIFHLVDTPLLSHQTRAEEADLQS